MRIPTLEKRIKRRITARKQSFFAACSPGLTKLCFREIQGLNQELESLAVVSGGVEFSGRVHDGYLANLCLRSPSRITMEVTRFKAENFRTLEKKLKAVNWELYLVKGAAISFEVSTRQSRLYHKGAIAQRAAAVIDDYLKGPVVSYDSGKTQGRFTLFIRGIRDRFIVSLDSSGDLLYKRGIKKEVGPAPLRENLAFAVLYWAGYTGNEPLVDPMCGSGSFTLEAAMIQRGMPPGWFRQFAFEAWPCFVKKRWNFLKQEAGRQIISEPEPGIFGSDLDGKLLPGLKKGLSHNGLDSGIQLFQNDFFDLDPGKLTREKGVVVLNPPYGRRLGEKKRIKQFYRQIGKKLGSDFKGWRAGLILPGKELLRMLDFKVSLQPIFHGGLELYAAIFTIE